MSRRVGNWAVLAFAILVTACSAGDFIGDGGPWDGGAVACMPGGAGDGGVTLRCPGNIDLGCVGSAGRRAFYAAPAATCTGGPLTVRCLPESGSTFMPGDTQVHCTVAADAGPMAACDFVVSAGTSGASRLRCNETFEAACTGATTMVQVPAPMSDNACGGRMGAVTNDAPAAGFPVGDTFVRFRMGDDVNCLTRVRVLDRAGPTIMCMTVPSVLRTVRGAVTPVPTPAATDACTANPTVTSAPASTTDHGTFAATFTATDSSGNATTCMGMATIRNAFAPSGLRVAHAQINGTGAGATTSVTIIWDHTRDADATEYRVERAMSPMGPWTMVGTTAPDRTRYVEPALPAPRAYYRVTSYVDGMMGGVTEPVRALAVGSSEYDLGVQPVPGLRIPANAMAGTPATTSAPLHAVVRFPSDLTNGPFPLVLLLHGNHGNCRPTTYDMTGTNPNRDDACITTNDGRCSSGTPAPNAQGLSYLAETLSSHGYVVASVDVNAINCREIVSATRVDGFISQRSLVLIEHLRRWRGWNAAGSAPFGAQFVGHVDMSRASLFGHSRGAEAVALVPQMLTSAPDVAGITLGSVFSLAPTNFDNPQPGNVPYATLVPICDGDVFTYNGVQLYDRTLRNVDTQPAVQIFLGTANHNHFSTEWRFDDATFGFPTCRSGAVEQPPVLRATLESTVTAWFDGTVPAMATLEPWLRASGDVPPGIDQYAAPADPLDMRRSYSSPRSLRIDNFDDVDLTANLLSGTYENDGPFADNSPRPCTGIAGPACDRAYTFMTPQGPLNFAWPHHNPFGPPPNRAAMVIAWSANAATLTANLGAGDGTFDASMYRVLSLRAASRSNALNASTLETQDVEVRITDGAGHTASAMSSEVVTLHHLYPSMAPRAVLQSIRFALEGLAARGTPPVDLHHLRNFQIVVGTDERPRGSMLFADFEFAD